MPVFAEIALSPVGLSAAFAAGVISFVSPCVWPLVPAYLSYVSGVSFHDLADQTRRVTTTTAAFVLGFGAVFTALGASAGAVGSALTEHRRTLEIASGLLIVLMGAVLAGFGGMLLQQERRLQPAPALHSAGRPAWVRRWRRSWHSRGVRGRRSTAPSCWPSTRSGSASPFCSRACSSRAGSRASPR
jgi:cytochrome c biogenesis protein CcdA